MVSATSSPPTEPGDEPGTEASMIFPRDLNITIEGELRRREFSSLNRIRLLTIICAALPLWERGTMVKLRLETLQAINVDFFDNLWAEEDLQKLVTPRFGVVPSFESLLSDLRRIGARDLGQVAPDALAQATDTGHD